MASLVHKALILARDRQDVGARVLNKLNSWFDCFSSPCSLTNVGDSAEVDACVARLFSPSHRPCIGSETLALERHIEASRTNNPDGPFPPEGFHNGTVTLGRLCYLACRYLRPRLVLETGVAYGVTSAYILAALAENDYGQLYSIDLPPLAPDAASHVGYFVPTGLRSRWKLSLGPAQELLPELLEHTKFIDMFVHDSLHTYSHMKWEFETALSALRPGGLLISDDIEGNRAFEEIIHRGDIHSWFAIRQQRKDTLCGAIRTQRAE
jgi:predicted O-methyltransferase YrrM